MKILLLGLLLFFGIHSFSIIALPLRDKFATNNEIGWKVIYSLFSLVGIILIAMGYGDLRQAPTYIYNAPAWMHYIVAVIMLPTFILFLAPYLPGRISRAIRHPQLLSVIIWAVAHLLVVGTLASIILFSSFLLWAMLDRISMINRATRPVPSALLSKTNDIILVAIGLAIYIATIFWLHETVLGMALVF